MSSDLTPHVAGRMIDPPKGTITLSLKRQDGGWETPPVALDPQGGFVLAVDLLPKRPNVFELVAKDEKGAAIANHATRPFPSASSGLLAACARPRAQ